MPYDIVARLRALAAEFPSLNGIMDNEFANAADEIERLRADRNQLRAEIVDRVLKFRSDVPWNTDSKARMKCEAYAAERGWFGLYDEINKLVSERETSDA